MVIPVGPPSGQTILRITKHLEPTARSPSSGKTSTRERRKEIFVPFTSKSGGVHRAADVKAAGDAAADEALRCPAGRPFSCIRMRACIRDRGHAGLLRGKLVQFRLHGDQHRAAGIRIAGTLLTLMGERIRANPETWMASSAFALGPSMAIAHAVAQHIPFNPVLIATDPCAALVDSPLLRCLRHSIFCRWDLHRNRLHDPGQQDASALFLEHAGFRPRWSPHPGIHVPLSPGFPHLSPGRDRGASCPPLLHPLERPGGQVQDKVSRGMLCHPHDSGRVPAALAIRAL